MKKIIYLISFFLLTFIISCEKELESVANETRVNLNGKWEVNAYNDTTFVFGPFNIVTLQETVNSDSITIKDSEVKFWKFEVKANANAKNGAFETDLSNCLVS